MQIHHIPPTPRAPRWRRALAALHRAFAFAGSREQIAPAPPRAFAMPPQPLSPAQHWSRMAAVIETAGRATDLARELQEKALVQLEVAEFALDQIFDEVAEVMAITPRMRTTRERVTAARPSHGLALAA